MEQLHPSEIDLGLERIQSVAKCLGLQQHHASAKPRIITIGGTNGKGSCVATLEAFLLRRQRSVGAYTSPHILRYNERVKVNGHAVTDEVLCAAFQRIDEARGEISLTYFEFGTLAAFLIFKEAQIDYWLLEVGLGGRLDAVNIVDPDVAIITSIALDHEQWLGETRESIATEKLGILRSEAVFICGEQDPPENVLATVNKLRCPSYFINQHFTVERDKLITEFKLTKNLTNKEPLEIVIETSAVHLPVMSIATALQALHLFEDLPTQAECQAVLQGLYLPGRFEQLECNGVQVILDVAHNPAAAQQLADHLTQAGVERCHIVIAMMADKKIDACLQHLLSFGQRWYVSEISSLPRSAKSQVIAEKLLQQGVTESGIAQLPSVEQALIQAIHDAEHEADTIYEMDAMWESGTVVLVFGSFYTVAEAHHYFSQHIL